MSGGIFHHKIHVECIAGQTQQDKDNQEGSLKGGTMKVSWLGAGVENKHHVYISGSRKCPVRGLLIIIYFWKNGK